MAIAAVAANAAANGVTVEAALGDRLGGDAENADIVFAGDVFYSRAMTERVLPFLERAAARGATVLVGDPGRAYLPRERFESVAVYEVPVTRALESADVKATTIWRPNLRF
jgi:predicted nicotinamide N-methyase